MSSIIIDKAEQRYRDLLKKIAEQRTSAEADNLARYHRTGVMVDDLLGSQETRRYGERTVDMLATDLKAMPEFSDMLDVKRFLYWSLELSKQYTIEELSDLAMLGFTVSHAKALLSLSEKVRSAVAAKMIVGGRVVPSRKMTDVIKEVCRERLTTESAAKTGPEAPEEVVEATDAVLADPEPVVIAKAPVLTTPPPIAAPKPKAKEGKAKEVDAPPASEAPVSPLKTLKAMDKMLVKLMTTIPDALIVIRETGKRGFDSDAAQKNYEKLLADVSAGIKDVVEPLVALQKDIDDQRGA